MPSPGATPVPDYDALDLGRDANGRWLIGTKYSDGSYVIWDAATEQEVAYIAPGRTDPADLGGGRAAVANPDGSLLAFDIKNPPPQVAGAPAGAAAPGTPAGPAGPTPPGGSGQPGAPAAGTYYPGTYGGQTQRGSVPFGQTVAPGTWNPASPGRSEGWGSIGAGTAGIQYGYGSPGFGQDLIKIDPANLAGLADPTVAPGYIPGSGTYNQRRLDAQEPRFPGAPQGMFGEIPGQSGIVNRFFGQGGPGDPTTGGELQTPERWVQGTGSTTPMQGDAKWRATGGMWKGGGGWDAAWAGAVPGYRPGPGVSAPSGPMAASGYGASGPPTQQGMGGGGMGGGMFGSNVTSNWGQTAETAGLDFIATLFLRSDTPTGIGTPAWSAPPQMWNALLDEIRKGRIFVQDPAAWQMLSEKFGRPITPQTLGGAATSGQNAQPGGGSTTEDAIANGNAAEAADKAAYWAYQQSLLRQGDQRLALEEARDAWTKAYNTATMTGQFNGADTMAMQQQRHAQGIAEAGVTGLYNGQDTMAKIAQQNAAAQALLGLQAQMQGPRNWSAYQRTFGATPQGLKDVMGAYMGRYQLPTGQGAQGTAQGGVQSVAGLGGDILSGTYGQDGQSGMATINPRQADVQNWARMQPSQREMILGDYEQKGWYAPDVENLIKGAAPKYSGPQTGSYNFFQS